VDRRDKAMELLERAAKLGLRVEFQSGMNILKKSAPVDPKLITLIMEQLVNYLPEVRDISKRRAIAVLGKTLASRRIWSKEHGEGTLLEASEDGALTISICAETRRSDEEEVRLSRTSITASAESLLILLDEEMADGASSPHNDEPKSALPRKGIFERFRTGSRED
jgi:hypothetical protein